jgi:hypothetical protein
VTTSGVDPGIAFPVDGDPTGDTGTTIKSKTERYFNHYDVRNSVWVKSASNFDINFLENDNNFIKNRALPSRVKQGTQDFAASFNGTSQYLNIADNANIRPQNEDLAIWGTLKLTDKSHNQFIISKSDTTSVSLRLFEFKYTTSIDRFQFTYGNGTSIATVDADTFGNVPVDTWLWFYLEWDISATRIRIRINNGNDDNEPLVAGNPTHTPDLLIGNVSNIAPNSYFEGAIDKVGMMIGGTPNSAERAVLYGGGTPVRYEARPDTIDPELALWWEMDEATGASRLDSHASNNLSDNNNVSQILAFS